MQTSFYGGGFFFFCHPVTEHSNDQLASCVHVHFFLNGK